MSPYEISFLFIFKHTLVMYAKREFIPLEILTSVCFKQLNDHTSFRRPLRVFENETRFVLAGLLRFM